MSVAILASMLSLNMISIIPSVTSHILQHRADPVAASTQATSIVSSAGLLLPNLPTSNSNVSLSALNSLNLSTSQIGIPRPQCDRELGIDLNQQSCVNAYYVLDSYLKDLPKQDVTVGERGQGIWDLPDPTRFLSIDTNCAFEVSLWVGHSDLISKRDITSAALSLLNTCVRSVPVNGGRIQSLGNTQSVVLAVKHNQPFLTTCVTPPPKGPPLQSCRNLRKNMPVGTVDQSFGPKGTEEEVTLPFSLYSDDDRCVLTIHTESGPDIMNWQTIYQAATEMEAKCVTQGKSAAVAELGRSAELFLTMRDASQPPSLAVTS